MLIQHKCLTTYRYMTKTHTPTELVKRIDVKTGIDDYDMRYT